MSSRSKRRKENTKARQGPLVTIADELLLRILDHVQSKNDLANTCLVSSCLYSLTIDVLYRHLSIDLDAASHTRLLRRLAHPRTLLPQRIQTLRVEASRWCFEHWTNLYALLHGMTNLKLFGWVGPLRALQNIPEIIHTRFPKAVMEIKDSDCFLVDFSDDDEDGSEAEDLLTRTVLTHPLRSRITQITLFLSGAYPNFKRDLVDFLLHNNRNLRLISIRVLEGASFPSHIAEFKNGKLPNPIVLDLGNTKSAMFTPQELKRWGEQGGWDRLSSLETGSMECFRCFVGCSVGLKKLALYTTEHEGNDLAMIDQILASANTTVPFPELWYFKCVEQNVELRPDLRFMPVNILRYMPKLTYLMLAHGENMWFQDLEPELPSPQHIRDIRYSCPQLEQLVLVMGLAEDLPKDLVKELASFRKLINLNLFVCLPIDREVEGRWRDYWRIAREMYHERKRLGYMWKQPFAVQFTTVGQLEDLPIDKVESPEICFENFQTRFGGITTPYFVDDTSPAGRSRLPDKMTDEVLEGKQFRTIFGCPVWRRRRITREIKRRKKDKRTVLSDDEYPTLYDAMVRRDN